MRISSGMIFDAGVAGINRQTATLLHVQQQVSSMKRILTPSDDPVAAARALEVTQSSDAVAQFKRNMDSATSSLGLEESQLSSAADVLARVRELAVQAGNTGTLTASDRQTIATELRSSFGQLLGIANATDGTGQHIFSGFMGATSPFGGSVDNIMLTGNDVTYSGDSGQRTLQVSASRSIATSDAGNDVFARISNGNGYFVTNSPANSTTAAATIGLAAQTSVAATSITATFTSSTETAPRGDASFSFLTGATKAATNDNLFAATQTGAGLAALAAGGYTATQTVPGGAVQFVLAGTTTGTAFTADFAGGAAGDVVALGVPTGAYAGGTAATDLAGSFVTGNTVTATGIQPNAGSGVIDAGSITSPAAWSAATTKNIAVKFTVTAGVTTYDLVDTVSGNSLLSNAAAPAPLATQRTFQSGQPVVLSQVGPPAFDLGASITITGTPATGDSFSISPSSSQSVFATVAKLIGALEAPRGTPAANAQLANQIGFALTNIDQAGSNILRVITQIGSRMNEIDSLSNLNQDMTLQYQQTLSNLQDLDYAKAISDLTRNQTALQAAQQSFVKISQLSLFNYL